jgi:hypothetical protein
MKIAVRRWECPASEARVRFGRGVVMDSQRAPQGDVQLGQHTWHEFAWVTLQATDHQPGITEGIPVMEEHRQARLGRRFESGDCAGQG